MRELGIVLFAVVTGFAVSGIVANFYRIVCQALRLTTESRAGRAVRAAVMVFAGPNVLFETAIRGVRAKQWKLFYFWIVAVVVAYWSLVLGLFVLDLAVHF